MDEDEKAPELEYGGAEVPVHNDPDSMELRRQADHDHFWVPAPDPLHRHPNRKVCMICKMQIDENQQSQPWSPPPRIERAGI